LSFDDDGIASDNSLLHEIGIVSHVLTPLLQLAREDVEVTVTMQHTVECFLGFAGLLRVEMDIVPTVKAAASIAQALNVAPHFDRNASDRVALWWTGTVAGGKVCIVDVDLTKRTMDTEFFLHDDLL
jgi:hypothetical protein